MKRVESSVDKIVTDIKNFYQYDKHHFITINAVDLGEKIEVQWFFCEYEKPSDVIMFFIQINPTEQIPTIKKVIPAAWVAEAELVDLMGINIENTPKGFVLEEDFKEVPLRKK